MKFSKDHLDEFHKDLALFVKEHRQEKGWSRYMLSKMSGCSYATIKYIENNQDKDYKIMTVKKVMDAFDETIDHLYKDHHNVHNITGSDNKNNNYVIKDILGKWDAPNPDPAESTHMIVFFKPDDTCDQYIKITDTVPSRNIPFTLSSNIISFGNFHFKIISIKNKVMKAKRMKTKRMNDAEFIFHKI